MAEDIVVKALGGENSIVLFTPLEVAAASLLGSPLAGCGLLARNLWRGGYKAEVDDEGIANPVAKKRIKRLLWLGLGLTLVYLFLLWLCPNWTLRFIVAGLQMIALYALAGYLTPSVGEEGDDARLTHAPFWHAGIAGGTGLVLVILVLWGVSQLTSLSFGGKHWRYLAAQVGVGHEGILYASASLEPDALKLKDTLLENSYLVRDTHRLVLLNYNADGAKVIWLIAPRDQFDSAKGKSQVQDVVSLASTLKDRHGVVVRLVDEQFGQISETVVK